MSPWQRTLVSTLSATRGIPAGQAGRAAWSRIGGNALSSVWSLVVPPARFFVKIADPAYEGMLAAEAEGLRAIAATGAIRVPAVYSSGSVEGAVFLATEWLDIVDGGRGAALGTALAVVHASTAPRFGWHRDNTIGTSHQANDWCDDWATFFRDRRLAPQLALAARNGHGASLAARGERLLSRVGALLKAHRPPASLLHGDLWAGNAGRLEDGTPVVFDPATYYGDREADLAMTELFGGFTGAFYSAYEEAAPLPAGHEVRRTLYNLYHVLNHLNLFGGSYLARCEAMIDELIAAAG